MVKLFIIGAGKMGGAIAGGLVSRGVLSVDELAAFDVSGEAAGGFARRVGCSGFSTVESAMECIASAPTILLAVKPQVYESALELWLDSGIALSKKLLISIVAGVTLEKLAARIGGDRIVRVMPNTPALVGCGAAAYAPGDGATADDTAQVESIFSAVGMVRRMKENELDAVTALSGSGPAYVFEFIQALADGGVAEGLSREAALALAIQTVYGAAEMASRSGDHPSALRDAVTSPGGTTIRALEVLADRGFSGAVIQAVRAAARRSRELGGRK